MKTPLPEMDKAILATRIKRDAMLQKSLRARFSPSLKGFLLIILSVLASMGLADTDANLMEKVIISVSFAMATVGQIDIHYMQRQVQAAVDMLEEFHGRDM